MIVGAGLGQLPAILTSKKMGLKAIAIDKNPNALGMKYADVALPIDVIDIPGALDAAKKYKIKGILTMQSDFPVPTVGAIVDELGLFGVGYEVAMRCNNKIETKKWFVEKNIPSPKFFEANTLEEAEDAVEKLGFPCMIKPSDSSGSRGVSKITANKEVENAYNEVLKYSKSGQVCVEEFIEGIEIGAAGFSLKANCEVVLVHNDTLSQPPYFVPVGHSFPSMFAREQLENVKKAVTASVNTIGIPCGPTNIDLIFTKDNEPKIIEIGARIGATCLPELVHYYTGIDWVKAAIQCALGDKPDLKPTQEVPCAAMILDAPKDGVLKGYSIPSHLKNDKHVLEIEVEAKIGEKLNKLRNGTDRIGKVVATGTDWKDAEKRVEEVKSQIIFDIE